MLLINAYGKDSTYFIRAPMKYEFGGRGKVGK